MQIITHKSRFMYSTSTSRNFLKTILCLGILSLGHFSFAADYYWVGGSGVWTDLSHWATTSGGSTSHTIVPSPLDRVIFDANSFTADGQTVAVNFEVFCDRLEASNLGFQVNFDFNSGFNASSGIDISGDIDWTQSGNLTIGAGGLNLGSGATLTSNGTNNITGGIVIQANASLIHNGLMTLDGDFELVSDNSYIQNSGETNVTNGNVILGNNALYHSKGGYWMRIYDGNLQMVSGAEFRKDRGYIDFRVGDLVIPGGAIFNTGSGQRWIRNGGFIAEANSTITVNGDFMVLYDGGLDLDPAANILIWNTSNIYFRATQFGQHTIRSSGINLRRLQFDDTNRNAEYSLLDDLTALNDGVFLYSNKFISNGFHIQAYHFYCWTTGVVAIDLTGTDSVNVSSQFRLYPSTNTTLTWDTPHIIWESTDHQYLFAGTNNSFDTLEFRSNNTGDRLIQIQYSTTVKNVKVHAKGEQRMNLLNGSTYGKFVWEYEKSTINTPDLYMQGGNTFQDTFSIRSSGTMRPKLRTHGNNTFGVFDIGDRVKEWEIQAGTVQTSSEITPLTGTCERTILITSNSLGSVGKISQASGTVSGDYLQLQDNDVSGGATFNAINTADLGNVSGWNITAIPGQDFYWIGENGNWSDPNNWSLSSGGVPYCAIPSRIDNVIFDANSFSASNQFASVDVPAECNDMNWNGIVAGAGLSNNQLLEIYGSLKLDANMNFAYSGRMDFQAIDNNNTVETAGKVVREMRFEGQGQSTGVWTLVDDLTSSNWVYINRGTFNSDGNNITAYSISTSNSTVNFTNGTTQIQVQHRFEPNGTTILDMGIADVLFEANNQHMYFRYANGHTFNDVTFNQNSTGGHQVIIEHNHNSSFNNWEVNQKGSSWVRWDHNSNNDYDTVIVNQTNRGFTRLYNTRQDTFGVFQMLHTGTANYAPRFEVHSNSHSLQFDKFEYFGENDIIPYFWADRGFSADTFTTRNLSYIRLHPSYTYTFDTLGIQGSCLQRTLLHSRTGGSQVTLDVASSAHIDFGLIKDMNATGAGTYTSGNTIDGGNVNGWPVGNGVNLYWVGGTGNWNDPNHWSLTSGGAPAGCMPSQGDNVFFDVNSFTASGQTVNINVTASCHNMIWNNVNSPSLIGGSTLNIHGSLRLAPNLSWNHSGWTYFQSRNTGNTITTNGVQMRQIQFLGDGVYTGEWTLQDNLDVRYDLYTTYGSFVSGGHRVSCRSFFSNNNNVNTSVDFTGTDLISVRHRFELHNNPTFNIGSANIQWQNMEGGYYRFYGYGKTFNDLLFDHDDGANRIELHHNNNVQNLVINSTAYPTVTINGNSSYNDVNMVFDNNTTFIPQVTFTGTNNINVLSITSLGNGGPYINLNNNNTFNDLVAAGLGTRLLLGAGRTQTVNGLLALGNGSFPVFVKSQTDGSQATIYMPEGEVCLDFILLQDIIGNGDPDGNGGIKTSFFAGNSSVDLGNNTNWQFSSCFAYYWVGDSGNWSDFASHWATSSGGTTFHSTVPGPTDNVYFDANSFTTNNQNVTVDVANAEAHNMTWQSALFTPTITGNTQINIYGDLELISNMNQDFTGNWNFRAADNGNILNTAAKTMGTLNFYGGNDGEGEWILQNTLSVTSDINLNNGTLITNDKAISAANFNSTTANTRSLQLGASTVTIKDGNWNPATLSGATMDAGTSTIIISGTNTAGFLGNGLTYHDVTFTTSSSLSADLSGANTFNTLRIEPGLILTVEPVIQTMTALEANASCDNLITIQSSVAGTPATFSQATGTVDASFLNLKDNTATGGATFNANFSNDNGGNTAWTFSDPPQLLVTTGTGAVDCVTNNDGFAEVSGISGGTPPYTYLWSTSETTDRIENLIPGSYTVVISDASGCSVTEQIEVVNEPANITATSFIASDTEICLGETIQFTAGTPPESVASYLWDFGDFSTSTDQNPSHTFAAGGTYTVSLSYLDGNGCPAIVSQDITVSDLQVTVASNNIACFGTNDGSISITATGGAKPIQYSIDNGANYFTDGDFIGLSPGTYQVIVKDAFDCTTGVQTITLTEPASDLSFTVAITHVSCSAATDGALTIVPSGGTPPYDYSINNGIAYLSTPNFTDLGFGSYNVLVRDDNNCVAAVQVSNIVVEDNVLPTISCPADVSETALLGDCDATLSVGSPTTDDDCGIASLINDFNGTADASGTYPAGTTVVTWTVTDVNGNTADCSLNVTVTESTDPTITCAGAITVNNDAGQCQGAVAVIAPSYSDNCSVPPALSLSNDFNNTADASDTYPVGLTVVNWTVTDAAGNTASCTQDITVLDVEMASISCPGDVTVSTDNGSCEATNVTLGTATTTDNCTSVTPTNDAPVSFSLGTTTVTWTADHGGGNVVTCVQNLTVTDGEAPNIICPAAITITPDVGTCTATNPVLGIATATDNCATILPTNNAPSTFSAATTIVTYTADDGVNPAVTCMQEVTLLISDNDQDGICDSGDLDDDNDGILDINECSFDELVRIGFEGAQAINDAASASDPKSNFFSGFNFSGTDVDYIIRSPDFVADIVGTQWYMSGEGNSFAVIQASNNTPKSSGNDGLGFSISATELAAAGAASGDPFTISFLYSPGWNYFAARPSDADSGIEVWFGNGTFNSFASLPPTTNATVTVGAWSPTQFIGGFPVMPTDSWEVFSSSFTWTGGDVYIAVQAVSGPQTGTETIFFDDIQLVFPQTCANTDGDALINAFDTDSDGDGCVDAIEAGHTDPDDDGILGISPVTVDAQGLVIGQGGYTGGNDAVLDNTDTSACCDLSLNNVIASDEVCPGAGDGSIVVTATCTTCAAIEYSLDGVNFQSSNTFTDLVPGTYNIVVQDTADPDCRVTASATINAGIDSENPATPVLTDITGECEATAIAPTTTDNCAGTITGTTNDPLNYTTQGTHVIEWTFDDGNGNTITVNQNVIVDDVTDPVTPVLADVIGECEATASIPSTTDNCTGTITGTTSDPLSYTTQGTHVIEWTFDDGNGNVITVNQNVIVDDITNPVTPVLADVIGECEATASVPTTTDNCTGTITGTTTDPLTYNTQGTHTIEWTFDDGNGNVVSVNQNVIVEDVTDPATPILADVTGECEATATAPTTTDNCSGTITGTTTDPLTYNTQGTHTIEWTFDDGNGNVISVNQNVIIEDETAPVAACTDITIDLVDRNTYSLTQANIDAIAAGTSDNCPSVSYAITAGTTDYDCDDRNAQFVVTLTATDIVGLTHSCTATVTIADPNSVCNDPPTAVCQDITIFTGANCDASIVAADVDGGSTDPDLDPLDRVVDNEGPFGVGTHTVTLTVSDGEFNDNCTATVTVEDNTNPIALCQDVTVQLDANGLGSLTKTDVDNGSNDACGILSLSLDDEEFECKDIDAGTVVTLTVVDNNSNSSTCTANVTVVDNIAPVASCNDITIQLDIAGSASITSTDIDAGSNDACGMDNSSLDVSTFDCSDIGDNTVTLLVADVNANQNSCTATVTVEDQVAPVATCQDITIQLDATGNADITTADIDNGSSDACGIASLSLDQTDFSCSEVGPNTVTLTVTDNNGNASSCTANVAVEDLVIPTATCQDITIQLDATGNANITTADIDDGSSDACGIASLSLDQIDFACSEVGPNTVNLTATDNHGNTSTCSAQVSVQDLVAPVATCQDITIQLDENGDAAIATLDIDNGSSDACGIANLSLDQTSFSCDDVGLAVSADYSLDFDGINDYLNAGNDPSLKITGTAVTVEAWIKTPNFVSLIEGDIINKQQLAGEAGYFIRAGGNGDIQFYIGTPAGWKFVQANSVLTTNTWHYVAGVYNGSDMKLYVDGTQVAITTGVTETIDDTDNDLCIGCQLDNSHRWRGQIDETRVWNIARTPAEIAANYNQTLTGNEPGLVLYYAMEDGPGSPTVSDLSTEGNDAILTNMDPNTDWVNGVPGLSVGSSDANQVTLTVTDNNGNSNSCIAYITVEDKIAPVALCQDLTVQLNANGDATITVNDIDNSSSDACGIESLVLDETSFDCADVGENEVMLIATDVNNNADTCYATVTVEDQVAPIALCQDITIQLDAGTNNGDGTVSIVPEDIDNGSNDACGIASLALDLTDFDCGNVGANTVILSVTDNHNNVSTCSAEVSVEDKIGPVISSCPPDQVLANTPGDCSTLASWAIPALSDNCDTAPIGIFTAPGVNIVLNAFGQFPVGTTTVTFTVTDQHENETSCDFTVTVNDVEPPTITSCPTSDITVDNEIGLCEAEVDYGVLIASDNCAGVIFTADTDHDIDGDIFTVGTTPVSFTATDAVGLQTVCSFNVTVNDTELPIANCEDITIQLDAAGSATIVPDDVFVSATDNCEVDNNSLVIDQTSFDCSQVGANTVEVSIDDIYGNTGTCTSIVTVEDQVAPIALCQDITVQLDENGLGSISTVDIDNGSNDACGIQSLSLDITNFSCTDAGGDNTVRLTVLDNNSNSSSCTATVTVEDNVAPIALCQDVTVQLDILGDASITTADIDDGSNDACGIQSLSLNNNDFTCADVGNANTVILTVTDNNGNISSCQANITVEDEVVPVALCQDLTIQLDAAGNASITASQIDNGSNDACGIDILSATPSVFDCSDIGLNTVTLTVVDVNGNQSTCSSSITVEDPVAPVAICQDLTVQLDVAGNASITPAQVDNGSNDACGIGLLSLDNETFDCASVGPNTVTLTVVDNNDQASTCTAIVTVEDRIEPIALCQDLSIQLAPTGTASITAAQINNGSNDACGIASFAIDITEFDCDNINATNTVSLTATDVNGNSNSCTAIITVEDAIAPTAICQDLTVQLDANGDATITASSVDNGSNDACGIASLSLDDTDFDCADVGANTVTLTVTDAHDNVNTCTASIAIEDNVAPIALCQDVTVQLDASGTGTLTTIAVDDGSNDACGVAQLSLDNTDFTCADIGIANTVTLTVVDNHNNSSTCTANITVEDKVAPVALCQDVTLQLGVTGEAVLKPSQVDAGSNDACGIADVDIDITHFTCDAIATNNIVTLTATDINGNTSICTATISIEDNEAPDASCKAATVQLDDTGNASITITDIDGGSVDNCGIASRELDRTDFTCADIGALNFVTLTLTDVNGNVSTCGAGVIVEDNVDPVAQCEDIVVQLDATGQLTISPADVDGGSNDACGLTPLFLNETTFTCADIGDNTVSLTVTDDNGNESTCEATVTVEDNVLPIASCQNLVVQLDDTGTSSITAAQIDNGSSDACGIANLSLDLSDFDCSDVGANTVILTVTDVNDNSSTCPAIVTVQDNVAPIAVCQDVSIQLDTNGEATISSSMINNGSNDACGIADLSLDKMDFNCSDVGYNTITLTIKDNNDNTSNCVANVMVEDLVVPVALCQDLTIQLDANGEALVEATAVNNGSSDACGIADYNFLMGTTELITNGGFDTDAAGWAIDGVHVTYYNSGGNPDGWLWLNGVGNSGFDPSASQTVSGLTVGQVYTLNGSTRNHANCCGAFVGQAALAIDIDGIEQTTINNPGTTWTDFSHSFTASNTTHTFRFRSEINGHDTDMGIDNISISGTAMELGSKAFDCSQVGSNTMTLQVTDNNANASTCTANITIVDNIAPMALCQNITIQLDANGAAGITTADIDAGSNDACGIASLGLDHTDFDCTDIGANTVTLTVTDNNGNENTCAATVTVGDEVAPIALCQDMTVQLDDSGVGNITTSDIDLGSNDACGIASLAIDHTDFDCTDVGVNTVTLTVTDNNGNENTCTATVFVEDKVAPIALCQAVTVQLDDSGVGSIATSDIDLGSNDACGIASLAIDHTDFDCTDVGTNTVTLTVTDNNGNENTCTSTVTVEDEVEPVALCQNANVQLDAAGLANITTTDIDGGSTDACGIASIVLDKTDFDCADVGANTVTLTVTDDNANISTCTATVTVEDKVAPIALCQNVSVQLDAAGAGSIVASDVDAGSTDACGFASLVLDATDFTCTDVGANTVTLTATDNNGNVSTCTATVTVEDKVTPIALCQDVIIQLDAAGFANIAEATIDAGSNDACGIASLTLDNTDFDCTSVGTNTVTLTVMDNNSNLSTCTATVTVEDKVAPIALCQDLTIQLDAAGAASISAAAIDNGSNDACGITSLALDITDFDCADIGGNTVSLTATDNNGNSASCTATVTVEDNVVPIALCQDITVQLTSLGQAFILPNMVDNGSSDACGLTYELDITSFDCSAVTIPVAVELTVSDPSGNTASCSATVTVEDNIAPIAICQDITVQLDAEGQANTNATAIDAGSTDACGIATIDLDQNSFGCAEVGPNTVQLTLTDIHGNISTCTATVTVEDDIAPTASCKDVSITLDDTGLARLETEDVAVTGTGFAQFVDSGQRLSRKRTEGLGLADFDGDGDLDAFTANFRQGNRVWLNNGNAEFNSNGQNLGRFKSCGIDVGDLDGDGDVDAFVGNYGQGNRVWLNNGNARFWHNGQSLGNRRTLGLKLGDLDGDGDLDAFVANDGQANKVWINNGNGRFHWRGQYMAYNYSQDVDLGDLDGDGDLDAFVVNYRQGNRVWLNDGTGRFTRTNQSLGWFESKGVELGDLDGDGDLDAFVANEGRADRVWINNGSAHFADGGQHLGYYHSTDVALGFINGDSGLDAFVAHYGQGNKVWLNNGNADYNHGGQYLGQNPSSGVKLGDLDGDGDLDAFVSNYGKPNWVWLNNYSSGIADNCGIADISLSDEAFDCFDLGEHVVTVTVTDVNNNSSTCTATVTVLSQQGYDTADINHNGNLDDDCDGVADACDVCPGADDMLDSDNDGIPDCKDWEGFDNLPDEWKCGGSRRWGPNKVEICHVPYGNPDNAHTICVSQRSVQSHLNHHGGDYLGPCFQITCGEDVIAEDNDNEDWDELERNVLPAQAIEEAKVFSDSSNAIRPLNIKLFPNPADHESFLDWRDHIGEQAVVRVFNQLGQVIHLVKVEEINTPWLHIDLSKYSEGIYNVRVEIEGYEPTTRKLIVTKKGRAIKP